MINEIKFKKSNNFQWSENQFEIRKSFIFKYRRLAHNKIQQYLVSMSKVT